MNGIHRIQRQSFPREQDGDAPFQDHNLDNACTVEHETIFPPMIPNTQRQQNYLGALYASSWSESKVPYYPLFHHDDTDTQGEVGFFSHAAVGETSEPPPVLRVGPVKHTSAEEVKEAEEEEEEEEEVGYSFKPCRELVMIFPTHRSLPKLGNVLVNGVEYISPITKKPIREITFLPLSIDYRKLRKNPAFLVDAEIRGADITQDIVPRLDPLTLPKGQKANLAKWEELMRSREESDYADGEKSSDKPEDVRKKMMNCLRNLLANLKMNSRTKEMSQALFKDGLGFGFAVSTKLLKGDDVPESVRQTFQKFRALKPENWFHVSPFQTR